MVEIRKKNQAKTFTVHDSGINLGFDFLIDWPKVSAWIDITYKHIKKKREYIQPRETVHKKAWISPTVIVLCSSIEYSHFDVFPFWARKLKSLPCW